MAHRCVRGCMLASRSGRNYKGMCGGRDGKPMPGSSCFVNSRAFASRNRNPLL
jgi:hypothetical protein